MLSCASDWNLRLLGKWELKWNFAVGNAFAVLPCKGQNGNLPCGGLAGTVPCKLWGVLIVYINRSDILHKGGN